MSGPSFFADWIPNSLSGFLSNCTTPLKQFHQSLIDMTPTKQLIQPQKAASDGDGQGLLHDALEKQVSLISSFVTWLDNHIHDGRDHGGIVSKVKDQVDTFVEILDSLQQASRITFDELQWHIDTSIKPDANGGFKIIVTGPGEPKDHVEIIAQDQKEADYLMGVRNFCGHHGASGIED